VVVVADLVAVGVAAAEPEADAEFDVLEDPVSAEAAADAEALASGVALTSFVGVVSVAAPAAELLPERLNPVSAARPAW
jgi:hypothetical protein